MVKLSQRLRVWRGEIRKTTGGLTKADLHKNKAGKIVSKRKSLAAVKKNNLGPWIRAKGDSFSGKPAAFPKKARKSEAVDLTGGPRKLAAAKPKKLLKKATAAAKKMARSQKPQKKTEPKPKKADVIDLSGLQEDLQFDMDDFDF